MPAIIFIDRWYFNEREVLAIHSRDGRAYLKKTGTEGAESRRRGMLFDLILALLAAVLVGLLPGWFWAKLLIATPADVYERIAYSVALSMALVPTAALVQARLLETGVTLTIAVASPL